MANDMVTVHIADISVAPISIAITIMQFMTAKLKYREEIARQKNGEGFCVQFFRVFSTKSNLRKAAAILRPSKSLKYSVPKYRLRHDSKYCSAS